jgi:DNA-binding transcriptional MerR regulator/methylmalonyl-CoA mutase cobalamin-binding subunit
MTYEEPRHPINFVAHRTGLSTHVIRVWERRYAAIQPQRTDTNRRLYSDADVDRLKLLNQVKAQGQSIRLIAQFPNQELKKMLTQVDGDKLAANLTLDARRSSDQEQRAKLMATCKDAVLTMNEEVLARTLLDASVQLPLLTLLDDLVGPLMAWIGERWHDGSIRVAHEHMATAAIRSFLGRMKQIRRAGVGAPCIVISTPAGQDHEIGALMAATIAANEGWRDLYLGPNLPAQEIALAAMETNAAAVAVSIVAPGNNPSVIHEFHTLRHVLQERIPVLAGGGGIVQSRHHYDLHGVYCVDNLAQFRDRLVALNS